LLEFDSFPLLLVALLFFIALLPFGDVAAEFSSLLFNGLDTYFVAGLAETNFAF
jgi:hypothetical protein